MSVLGCILTALCAPICWWQEQQQPPSDLTPRTIYYHEASSDDTQQGLQPTAASQSPKNKSAQPSGGSTAVGKAVRNGETAGTASAPNNPARRNGSQPGKPGVQHVGLRYNILLVDSRTGDTVPVATERVFQPGDCLAMEFEGNHRSYLYVLEQGSSGTWKPLLPSPEMPDETNILLPLVALRVPARHCFSVEGPPGVERIFVVLSREPGDVDALQQSIMKSKGSKDSDPSSATVLLTQNSLDQEVDRMRLQTRDLKIEEVAQPIAGKGTPHSVYVVNVSSVSPNAVVTEIQIHHQ